MADFVLVHSAWLGGWCRKKLVPLLAGHGHSVHTPTLTGLGERSHLAHPGIILQKSGQAQACPRHARGAQTPAAAGAHKHLDPGGTDEPAFGSHMGQKLQNPSRCHPPLS